MHEARSIMAGWSALWILLAVSLTCPATELYRDTAVVDGGLKMGATELFQYGPIGANGRWACTNITVSGSQSGLLLAEGGTGNGCHGVSVHLPYPEAFAEHGPLAPGHVLRLSCWLAVDPSGPVNRQDWQFALLKFEFYSKALADPHADPDTKLFDSDEDTLGELVTSYAGALSTNEWKRFSLDFVVDTNLVDITQLKEVRPVVVQGDFTGNEFSGNVLIDDLAIDVFESQEAADAHPVDDTPPGPLPAPAAP